jgi:hypothetical protein
MSFKKRSVGPKASKVERNIVWPEGKSDAFFVQSLSAETVMLTHADADHVLPTSLARLLECDSIVVLGDGKRGTLMRAENGMILYLPENGPAAFEVNVDHCVPPGRAEFFGALFLRPELREHVLGCRAEDFMHNALRFGRTRAVILYWWDIAASIRAPFWALLKRGVGLSALADVYRRVRGSW